MFDISFGNARVGFDVAMMLLSQLNIKLAAEGKPQYDLASANPTQSYLQSEIALVANSTQYHVPWTQNDNENGNQFPTERRVKLQDIFVPLSIGFFLTVPASATSGCGKFLTYENVTVLGTSPAAAAFPFWTGYFTMIVNNNQVLPAWDLGQHYYAPQTQQAANADYTTSGIALVDSFDGSCNGYVPVAPSFVMNGAANIASNIVLPSGLTAIATNSRIVVRQRGILLQNVTTVK